MRHSDQPAARAERRVLTLASSRWLRALRWRHETTLVGGGIRHPAGQHSPGVARVVLSAALIDPVAGSGHTWAWVDGKLTF